MNEVRFIAASFTSLEIYLKKITTKIDSHSWEEKELPEVEDCEKILEKISKLDEKCLTTIRNSYAASPSIVKYYREYSNNKVPKLKNECGILFNWTLNREINALEQRAVPNFLPVGCQGLAQFENQQKELLALTNRVSILSKKQNITPEQLERLNLLNQNLVSASNALIIEKKPEKETPKAQTFNLLERLPQEILEGICRHLLEEDLLRLGQCSKFLNALIQDENYWRFYLCSSYPMVSSRMDENPKQRYIELKRSERFEKNVRNAFYVRLKREKVGYDARINGDFVVYAPDLYTIELHDLKKDRAVMQLEGGATQRRLVTKTLHGSHCFTIKDDLLYSAAYNQIRVTDLKTKQSITTITAHKKFISDLQIDGNFLYSASVDKTIKVWDLKSRKCIATLREHTNAVFFFRIVNGFLYSLSDSFTFGIGWRSTLKCWALDSMQCLSTRQINNNNSTVRCLDVDGSLLYLGFTFGEIQVWNHIWMQHIRSISAYAETSSVSYIKVVGSFLFSGSTDFSKNKKHQIKIWDRRTLQPIQQLEEIHHKKHGIQRLDVRDNILYANLGDVVMAWDFSLSDMQFLATIPKVCQPVFSKLSNEMKFELSEEVYFHLPPRWNLSVSNLNWREEALTIYRYFLKHVLKALKIGKTAKAAHIFSLISWGVRKEILEKSKEASATEAIQNFLKETEQAIPQDLLWASYSPREHL